MNELNFSELERMEASDMPYQEVLHNETCAAHPAMFDAPAPPDYDEEEEEERWYDDDDDDDDDDFVPNYDDPDDDEEPDWGDDEDYENDEQF